jgi:hypothetical protein
MAKSRSILPLVAAAAGLAAVCAGGFFLYRFVTRDDPPKLEVPDIQEASRQVAHVERFRGTAFMRAAVPADEALPYAPFPAVSSGQTPSGWELVAAGASIKLGTLLHVGADSALELSSPGQWYMGFDGEGSVIFQDARRNAEGTEHTLSVYVQQGTFRAKAANDNYKGYFLEVTTAAAKVHVYEGEFGMQVVAQGKGRMWLMTGRAVAIWNDGRRKELGLRGLEDL